MKLYKHLISTGLLVATASGWSVPGYASDDDDAIRYEVTITNITRGQTFTPSLVATHRGNINLFTVGQPASDELATVAESGNVAPLAEALLATGKVQDIKNTGALLEPGESTVLVLEAGERANRVSIAAMLIPTNDAFFALDSVLLPKRKKATNYYISPAYDAGSEPNDELCASIPGPACGGEGLSPGVGGEDYVHIHAGIHGIGDLAPSVYDWRNPVASIMITRISSDD